MLCWSPSLQVRPDALSIASDGRRAEIPDVGCDKMARRPLRTQQTSQLGPGFITKSPARGSLMSCVGDYVLALIRTMRRRVIRAESNTPAAYPSRRDVHGTIPHCPNPGATRIRYVVSATGVLSVNRQHARITTERKKSLPLMHPDSTATSSTPNVRTRLLIVTINKREWTVKRQWIWITHRDLYQNISTRAAYLTHGSTRWIHSAQDFLLPVCAISRPV
jgi:hypothetical protein